MLFSATSGGGQRCLLPVTLRDCALAITVPLEYNEFVADLARTDIEYASRYRTSPQNEKSSCTPQKAWARYEKVAAFAAETGQYAETMGVTVRRRATLDDLAELTSRFGVVTLVTHWRFVPLEAASIIDMKRFLACLYEPANVVQNDIAQLLQARLAHLSELDDNEAGQEIISILAPIVNEAHASYSSGYDPGIIVQGDYESIKRTLEQTYEWAELTLQRLTRAAIEAGFNSNIISPAPAIEFQDGFRTLNDFIYAIPPDYDGVLDLTVCNSDVPGTLLRNSHHQCLVITRKYQVLLSIGMLHYKLMLLTLMYAAKQGKPTPYIEALTQVHRILREK